MSYPQIAKRFIPFLLAFAAGLFVASFFVSISPPSFRGFFRASEGCERMHRGKIRISVNELQELRDENQRLRNEVQMLREFLQDAGSREMAPELGLPPIEQKADAANALPPSKVSAGPRRPAAGY